MKSSKELDPEPMTLKPGQYGPNCKSRTFKGATDADNKCEDDPDAMDGAPCSIQIFTSRMRDEECLRAAAMIDRCLNPK
jgi:amidase